MLNVWRVVVDGNVSQQRTVEENFALRFLATKRHLVQNNSESAYFDFEFILPTSNVCERLFSVACYALGDRRGSILHANFESQLFMYANSRFWGVQEVVIIET